MMTEWLDAVVMGVVEAATEFLPVSSTGHLILAGHLLGFESPDGVFEVAIQTGAMFAVILLYFWKLWGVLVGLPTDPKARQFALAVLLAFLPAAVVGFFLHDFIKEVLFNPTVVCWALIGGGIAILAVERWAPKPDIRSVEGMGWKVALGVGAAQCLSMIPGVSRAGATILGALALRVERKTAAEFSFFLAIPTLVGAGVLDVWKARDTLTTDGLGLIAVGGIVAFLVALPIVKWFIGFVGRHGFAPFAYYRVVVGILGLLLLA